MGIDADILEKLKKQKIKTNKDFFLNYKHKQNRTELSKTIDVPDKELDKLFCLVNLTRINGVGPVFALMLYNLNIKSIDDLNNIDSNTFLDHVKALNKDKVYTKAKLTEKDIEYCKRFSEKLP